MFLTKLITSLGSGSHLKPLCRPCSSFLGLSPNRDSVTAWSRSETPAQPSRGFGSADELVQGQAGHFQVNKPQLVLGGTSGCGQSIPRAFRPSCCGSIQLSRTACSWASVLCWRYSVCQAAFPSIHGLVLLVPSQLSPPHRPARVPWAELVMPLCGSSVLSGGLMGKLGWPNCYRGGTACLAGVPLVCTRGQDPPSASTPSSQPSAHAWHSGKAY